MTLFTFSYAASFQNQYFIMGASYIANILLLDGTTEMHCFDSKGALLQYVQQVAFVRQDIVQIKLNRR